ncbi:hypothetical protein BD311DRAFT_141663 [Dichomitus squalens]|uniref:Uncharacterized protein n=1 Tax=Dichomitus squalens TaxID=114155 RepID=A0A4Q9M9X2_9APHY|nr:hypothetical protein BD311DRAFT_141663 [Dichomitus squalens]
MVSPLETIRTMRANRGGCLYGQGHVQARQRWNRRRYGGRGQPSTPLWLRVRQRYREISRFTFRGPRSLHCTSLSSGAGQDNRRGRVGLSIVSHLWAADVPDFPPGPKSTPECLQVRDRYHSDSAGGHQCESLLVLHVFPALKYCSSLRQRR